MRFVLPLLCALLLSACATNRPQYSWGAYEDLLYSAYKDPAQVEAMKVGLETHIGALEKSRQKVAPGLYAELGTLYLHAGAPAKAIEMYGRERELWPESKGLMDALITNLGRRKADAAEGGAK